MEELKRLLLKYAVCAYYADFFRVTHDFIVSGLEYKKGDILFGINNYSDEPKVKIGAGMYYQVIESIMNH